MRRREDRPLTEEQRHGIEELLAQAFDPVEESPDIDIDRLSQIHWYILVLWLHGITIIEIARTLRLREGEAGHPIRERKNGGYLPKARKDMTKEERNHHLNRLKERRMDDGKLPDLFFRVKNR